MIPDRAPTSIWCLSLSRLDSYVRTAPDDHIVLAGPDDMDCFSMIHLSRKDARLMAKRINQCLDATAKK